MGNDRTMRLGTSRGNSSMAAIATAAATAAAAATGAAADTSGGGSGEPSSPLDSRQSASGADDSCDKALVKSLLSYKNDISAYRATNSPTGELFPCQGCEDVFGLRASLVDHLLRKSILIRLPCPMCQCKRYFFNKCLAFRHVRSHYTDAAVPRLEAIVGLSTVMALPSNNSMPRSVAEELQQLECSVEALAVVGGGSGKLACTYATAATSASVVHSADAAAGQASARSSSSSHASLASAPMAGPRAAPVPELLAAASTGAATAAAAAVASPTAAQRKLLNCTECKQPFEDQLSLQMHFGKPQRGVPMTLRHACSTCGKAVFSGCALSAHVRMHSRSRPFVCPECAGVIDGEYEVFHKHVMYKCHHRSRVLDYTCAVCSEAFESLALLQQHWSNKPQHCLMAHYDHLCKCSNCPLAFKSEELFSEHTMDVTRPSCRRATALFVYVCRACDSVFRSLNELSMHNSAEHGLDLNQKRPATASYVYRCDLCRSSAYLTTPRFKTLQLYDGHLRQAHGQAVITEMCDVCGVEFRTAEELASHALAFHGNRDGTIPYPESLPDPLKASTPTVAPRSAPAAGGATAAATPADRRQLGLAVPTSVGAGDASLPPAATGSSKRPSSAASSVGLAAERRLPFACHLCGQRFATYVEQKEHALRIHNGVGQLLDCWICTEKSTSHKSFNSPFLLDKHLVDVHKIDVGAVRSVSSAADSRSDAGSSDGGGCSSAAAVRKRRGGTTEAGESKIAKEEEEEEEREAEPTAKRALVTDGSGASVGTGPVVAAAAADTERQCSHCGFRSHLRVEFVQHIRKHKADEEQCLECGMCFPVEMALRRHLFVVHHVQDVAAYAREHGPLPVDGASPAASLTALGSSGGNSGVMATLASVVGSDGRCLVCSRRFDSEAALRNHARSHGMAFINAKRAQSSAGVKSSSEDDSNDQASNAGAHTRK